MFLRLVLLLAACDSSPNKMNPGRDGMLLFGDEDMAMPQMNDDLSMKMQFDDLSMLSEDLKASVRTDMAQAGGCSLKVNELLLSAVKGATPKESEEYVEIFNPCPASKSLKNWSLRYRSVGNNSGAGNADTVLVADLSKTIAANGYLLWGGSQYGGSKDGTMTNGLSDAGGGVAIIDDKNNIVDSVAYGPVMASHNFLEGSAAPLPPQSAEPGKVIARTPNGSDSDDNSVDFVVATPTPKAAN